MNYEEFHKMIFKKTEERLREEYIRYLLGGGVLPPDEEDGFIWWLSTTNPELYVKEKVLEDEIEGLMDRLAGTGNLAIDPPQEWIADKTWSED